MRDLTLLERAQCQAMTLSFAKQLKTRKKKDDDKDSLKFSGEVRFSDTGNDTDTGNDDDFFKPEKEAAALDDIRRLTIQSEIQTTTGKYLSDRNKQLKTAKQNRLQTAKEMLKNRFGIG